MNLKASAFNLVIEQGNELRIWNTLYGKSSLIVVTDSEQIMNARDILEEPAHFLTHPLLGLMQQKGILVREDKDEFKFALANREKILYMQKTVITVMPTMACNFRCSYCYEDHMLLMMDDETEDALLRYLDKALDGQRMLVVNWFGGEPLLALNRIRSLSARIMELCRRRHILYVAGITTNGYLLTKDVFEELLKLHVMDFQVTLDGTQKQHDRQRPHINGGGTYQVINQNLLEISQLENRRHYQLTVRCNFTADNFSSFDQIYADFIGAFGVNQKFSFYASCVYDWGGKSVRQFDGTFLVDSDPAFMAKQISTDMERKYISRLDHTQNACHISGIGNFVCYPDGRVYTCTSNFDCALGNVKDLVPADICRMRKEQLRLADKCKHCDLFGMCLGLICQRMVDGPEHFCQEERKKAIYMIGSLPIEEMQPTTIKGVYQYGK